MMMAIDPGNEYTGYAVIGDDYKPIHFGKIDNNAFLDRMEMYRKTLPKNVVIEMVASYGMAVGATVFDTCVWIGRYTQFLDERGFKVSYVKRKEYVTDLCGSAKAKDANVIQYLIDRFAPTTPNRGKGSKKEPGWFYGFKADIWQAYAIAVWALDKYKRG